jgi:tRNA-specific 2-thiouridylase
MEKYQGKKYAPGSFLDLEGKAIGQHRGAVHYTLGQRKGLGLALGEPVYVCSKDMERNTVTVGPEAALFSTTLIAGDMNWISIPELKEPLAVLAKTRYNQKEQPATAYPLVKGKIKLVFKTPQRAITPGQATVLYTADGEGYVVGGSTIEKSV